MDKRRASTISVCMKWICDAVTGDGDTIDGISEKFATKEELRRDNERLCVDIETLTREHKKLKQIVDQLRQDYEQSKHFDPVRRFEILKGMIKRTIMHVKLGADSTTTGNKIGMRRLSYVQGCKELNFQTEISKRREEKYSRMSRQELEEEKATLLDQERELKRKTSILRDLIDNLQQGYEHSKDRNMLLRYSALKEIIKKVINDDLV